MKLSVNMIGAGHLGKTIAHLLVKAQQVKIAFICNRSKESALNAIQFIGQGDYCESIDQLPAADLTFITTPDDLIETTAKILSQNPKLKKGSLVLHCSGALDSDALIAVKNQGLYVASVHPMRSFAKPELAVQAYRETYCSIQGDEEALPLLLQLFKSIGSIPFNLAKKKKTLYHLAGVFSSNYLVTLAELARSYMVEAGLESDLALRIVTNVMQGSVSCLQKTLSPKLCLSGPIQRGDLATIKKHRAALNSVAEQELYAALGEATLHLTSHDEKKKKAIEAALTGVCLPIVPLIKP